MTNIIEYRISISYRYCLDIDYDTERNCGIGCDPICRCGTIENISINKVECSPSVNIKQNTGKNGRWVYLSPKKEPILEYCVDRLLVLNGVYDVNNYEVGVVNGYYGEEIGDVDFHNNATLSDDISRVVNLKNDIDRIKYVLEKEYTFIADFVKKVTDTEVVSIALKDINHHLFDKGFVKKEDTKYFIEVDTTLPIGVINKDNVLVDGNNRLLDVLSNHKPTKKVKMVKLYE